MTDAPKRGRPPKARLEGEAVDAVKAPVDPVPGDNGKALARIADYFRATYPDKWEELRLCPLQHGIDEMAKALRD